jgi:DNA replication protein DnaC
MEVQQQTESVPASDTSANEPKRIGDILDRLKLPYPRDAEVARQNAADWRWEERQKREAFRRKVPGRYKDCGFVNWTASTPYQAKVKAAAEQWAKQTGSHGLVLFGPVGTGKDHLAVAAIDFRVIQSNYSSTATFLNGREFVGEVRYRISEDSSESSLIDRYKSQDILLISDPLPPIGDLTQHQADMLYRVVEARYSAGKTTCCTLNVADDAEADRRLGAATWDRLCHGAWKIHCRWASHRRPAMELKP